MKILLVITKAVVGGAQMSVLNLAREMKARGYEVFVGFGEGDFLPGELDKDGIPFLRFDFLKRTHNPLAPLFFIAEIRKYVAEHHFDVVHFNSSNALPGALGAKLANPKTRTVFTFRGMSMLDEHYKMNGLLKFAYRCFFKIFLPFVNVPVFVSRENFDKFGQGQLTKKGLMIHNGLNRAKLSFLPNDEARGFLSRLAGKDLSQSYVVGSIGRLDYAKNYEFLISVFPEILKIRPEAVALIMGEGAERAKYESLIKEKGLVDKFFLLGNLDNGSRYLKGFDLLVLPSRYEGLSISLIEALFASLPILASDVGGNRETVGNNDQIYPLDDAEVFLAKFKRLQEVDALAKALADNAARAAEFDLKNTADGYERAYKGNK
jgi:glycosyltransferase involved in cell wall biosynthesis